MFFTDTHTHLNSESFNEDNTEVINQAIKNGVKKMIIPSVDKAGWESMLLLEKKYPENIQLMMGLHPTHVKEDYKEELAFVKEQIDLRPFAAIGEIGIDLYWDKTYLKEQQLAFDQQINWALEKNWPINIHCREAFDEIFEILEQYRSNSLRGILHCFTGDEAQAKKAIDLGLALGLGGVLTFKNGKIDRFMKNIPIENIVLETDAPYLAPTPYRGKRNESKYIPVIADKVSDIYEISLEEVARITNENAQKIYHNYPRQ